MARTAWLVLFGAVTGVAAIFAMDALLGSQRTPSASAVGVLAPDGGDDFESSGPIPAPAAFAVGREAAERAAGTSDPFDLERMIEELAVQPGSAESDAVIEALLARLATIDPRAAVWLSERLDLGADALAVALRAYAEQDPDAALDELAALSEPATRRAVAVAMLDVFGYDLAGIDRIAAAFPDVDALSFRMDALAALAERDPAAAFAAADAFVSNSTETTAQQRIATMLAGIDPLAAIEYGDTMTIALQRRRYLDRLFDGWAKLDPDGMLAYMETADLADMPLSPVSFQALAAASPERLLALAERFPPAQRASAQQSALAVLASMDPQTAYNAIGTLPPSDDRNRFIAGIAQAYVAQDAEAALAWVTSLNPRSPTAFTAVLTGIAASDPRRAAEFIVAEILNPAAANRAEMPNFAALLQPAMQAKSPEIAGIADMLSTHRDPRIRSQLAQLVQMWPQVDPAAATEWVMRDPTKLSAQSAGNFAMIVATENPELARSSVARIPEDARDEWITGAASGLARTDFSGTLRWLEGFRGQPAYEQALTGALATGAQSDPVAVARYLDGAPATALTPQVSGNLTRRWAATDAAAAERWTLALPEGAARDEALTGLMQSGNPASVSRLIGEYSSEQARTRGIQTGIATLARTDQAAARRLVAEHISDPQQRALAERQIAAMASTASRGATIINSGGNATIVSGGNATIVTADGNVIVLSPSGGATSTCGFTDPASGAVLPC